MYLGNHLIHGREYKGNARMQETMIRSLHLFLQKEVQAVEKILSDRNTYEIRSLK
jgi:hypothetical protein